MESLVGGLGGLIGDLAQMGVACIPFNHDLQGGSAGAQKEVSFPVAWLLAGVGFHGPLIDGNTVGDGDFNPRDPGPVSPTAVAANKRGDEVAGLGVDPLVDGFVANDGKFCLWFRRAFALVFKPPRDRLG